MSEPWMRDACALVEAFRAGSLSPLEALDASLAAIERSSLNAFAHLDPEPAREAARHADVSLPFGGVPIGVKELERVAGWPYTEASVPLRDEVATVDGTQVARLRAAGAVIPGLTTASEFGGVNLTRTTLHGTTRNPWGPEATPGGSSGGSAAAVAGGLLPLATAGDGGGSIRIPAAFTGLFGLKNTFGRIPKGPFTEVAPLTAVLGCLSRSVRDTARWLDVCNGYDRRDPYSLPRVDGWEAGLGTRDLSGLRVAVLRDFGGAIVRREVLDLVDEHAKALIGDAGLRQVDIICDLPSFSTAWMLAGLVAVRENLGDRWPACKDELTFEIAFGMSLADQLYNLEAASRVEHERTAMNEAMAAVFDQVDLVITATCPDVAFDAEGPLRTVVGGVDLMETHGMSVALGNNGALTIPANTSGYPAASIPMGTVDGLPVGLQIVADHHREDLLLDLAAICERERPWPLVAPDSPR